MQPTVIRSFGARCSDNTGFALIPYPFVFPFAAHSRQTRRMFLGQIAWVDIVVFLLFLAPQLLIDVGFVKTAICGIKALPFLRTFVIFQGARNILTGLKCW